MIFNELIEKVLQMKLKNQKQRDIRSFLRYENIFYLYCILVSYEKKSSILIPVVFFSPKNVNLYLADTFLRNRRCPLQTGLTVQGYYTHCFYKQHFYKQRQQGRSQDLNQPLQNITQNFDDDVISVTLTSLSWHRGKAWKILSIALSH